MSDVMEKPAEGDVPETTDREEFHITNESAANWYLRQLANLEAEKARVKAQAQEIVRGLDADANRLRGLFHGELEQWTREELQRRGGHKKTLPLLQGTCRFKTVPPRLAILDEEAVRQAVLTGEEWADCRRVSVDTSLYMKRAEEAAKQTGEILPGVGLTEERESFSVGYGKGNEE